jgi:hypothetical protein
MNARDPAVVGQGRVMVSAACRERPGVRRAARAEVGA